MEKTTFAIDGHVHLYPVFDLTLAVEKSIDALQKNATRKNGTVNSIPVWLLTERSDTDFFRQISEFPEQFTDKEKGIHFIPEKDQLTIRVEKNGRAVLYIFAGRQLVTRENLEVLSLISDLNIPDKDKPIDQVIQLVKESGGVACLNWAPGKWFFSRGKVVANLIESKTPDDFFIGETTLRHTLWRKPDLIKLAEKRGFQVIAGSDPLPFKGEENRIGSFGFVMNGEFDTTQPANSLRKIFKEDSSSISIIGKRNNIITFARRQYKIMAEKKKREN